MSKKKILVIGGGTGTYTVLAGLKKYRQLDLSVVVSMMDSGGSNRVIRDEFGLLPTSDIRQCIVALTEKKSSDVLRKLFTYRFSQGTGISGMTFGNLFMAALTDIYGSQALAIRKTCEFLDVLGKIIPVTYDKTHLVAEYDDGQKVLGEHFIDEPSEINLGKRIIKLSTFPPAKANPEAVSAIRRADMIIMGPGDLYTSLLCNVVVDKIGQNVAQSTAKKVFVMNLMTRAGQTEDFTAKDHLKELEHYLGKRCIDCCIVNNDYDYPRTALAWYKKVKTFPIVDDLGESGKLKIIKGSYFDKSIHKKAKSDKLIRSLIRHDPDKLAKAITSLL